MMDAEADVVNVQFAYSLLSLRQVKTDLPTTAFTELRQTESMSGSEPREEVSHLYKNIQYTSNMRHRD